MKWSPKNLKLNTTPLQFNFDINVLNSKFKLTIPDNKKQESKVKIVNLKKDKTKRDALF